MAAYRCKIESLQALRAIAFFAIFFHHCGTKFGGGWGVSVFFVLSGFLLVINHDNLAKFDCDFKSCIAFSWTHIKRLYPLHIIMTISAVPFLARAILLLGGNKIAKAILLPLVNFLLIQTWFPPEWIRYSMNNLSWYLSACVFLYAIFPVIYNFLIFGLDYGQCIRRMIIVYCLELGIGQLLNSALVIFGFEAEIIQGLTCNFPIYRALEFIIGCYLGKAYCIKNANLSENKSVSKLSTLPELVMLLIFIAEIFANYFLWNSDLLRVFRIVGMNTPSAIYTIWLFAAEGGYITRSVTNKFTIFIGNISPYLYLIHEMIIRYVNIGCRLSGLTNATVCFMLKFIIGICCSILLAVLWKRSRL